MQSAVEANAQENRAGLPRKVSVALSNPGMVSYVRVGHVVMSNGRWFFLKRRRNGKTLQRALKTAPRFFFGRKQHLYKSAFDWFSGWHSPVANADRSRPPGCRFYIPVETGGSKVTRSRKQNPSVAYCATGGRA